MYSSVWDANIIKSQRASFPLSVLFTRLSRCTKLPQSLSLLPFPLPPLLSQPERRKRGKEGRPLPPQAPVFCASFNGLLLLLRLPLSRGGGGGGGGGGDGCLRRRLCSWVGKGETGRKKGRRRRGKSLLPKLPQDEIGGGLGTGGQKLRKSRSKISYPGLQDVMTQMLAYASTTVNCSRIYRAIYNQKRENCIAKVQVAFHPWFSLI